jgi:hypothetical protein
MPAENFGAGDAMLGIVTRFSGPRVPNGKCGMLEDEVVGFQLHVIIRSEPEVIVLVFRRCVDPASLVPAERHFLIVSRDDVLPEFGADCFKEVAKMTDEGEISDNSVLALYQVVGDHERQNDYNAHREYENQTSLHQPSCKPRKSFSPMRPI